MSRSGELNVPTYAMSGPLASADCAVSRPAISSATTDASVEKNFDLTTIVIIIRHRERQINFETVVVFFCVLTAYVIVLSTILSLNKDMK